MDDTTEGASGRWLNEHVYVVRHDAPCEKQISLPIEVHERILDDFGHRWVLEAARPETGFQFPIGFRKVIRQLGEGLGNRAGQAVGKPEGYKLYDFGRVEMG
jgi:hypothetical protein